MKEILAYIVDKSSTFNVDKHQQLLQLLSGKAGRVGLLINERVVNLVPQVVPVLHNQLA
jgi:protein BCP1